MLYGFNEHAREIGTADLIREARRQGVVHPGYAEPAVAFTFQRVFLILACAVLPKKEEDWEARPVMF